MGEAEYLGEVLLNFFLIKQENWPTLTNIRSTFPRGKYVFLNNIPGFSIDPALRNHKKMFSCKNNNFD